MAQPAGEIPDTPVLLDVDARGRVSLGRMARGHKLFRARVEHDDTIILEPAVVLTKAEVAFHTTPVADVVQAFLEHPETGVRRARPRRRPDPEQGDMPPGQGGVL